MSALKDQIRADLKEAMKAKEKERTGTIRMLMAAIVVLYLFLGMFLDPIGIIVLTLPFVIPLIQGMDMNLIWFGVIVVKLLEIGLITPPVGMNVFVINGMARDVPMWESFKGVMPFLISDIIRIGFLIAFPVVTLGLVRALG